MSLANKYRPQTFDEMIGQEHIVDILKAQMKARETVHHNYLLFWPRGTGKTTSARLIAKGLNCLNLQNGNPCNACVNCQLINEGTSLDYTEIDAASHTGVDNIREEIIDKALYPPTALKKKIYVIDEVHMLSKGAFNALLKTIEEPKNNVCFIFATTEIHKVPDTIISRCQVFNYRKVSNAAMVKHLERITQSEGIQAMIPALEIIANISEGAVRDAVKYVDQVSILWAIDEENITKFLGVAGEATIKELLTLLKTRERDAIFQKLNIISESWIDLGQFAKQTIGYINEHLEEDTDFLLEVSEQFGYILSNLRRYPYPIIIYKIAINKYLNNYQEETEKKEGIKKPESPFPSQKGSASTTWFQNTSTQTPAGNQPIPTTEEQSIKSKETTGNSASFQKTESYPEPNTKEQTSTWMNKMPETTNKSFDGDFKTLRNQVVEQIQKPTVQSNLRDQAIIESIENGTIELIVITKIAEMLINNDENKKIIEWAFTQILWNPNVLEVKFENKEAYFTRKMGM